MVFSAVLASTRPGPGVESAEFLVSLAIGLTGGVIGMALLWLLLRKLRLGEVLGTAAQLAAIVLGLAVRNMRGFDIPARRPFFETLVHLMVGLLFVSIAATVTPASLRHLVLPALGLVAVLVLVTRPLVALLATLRTDLSKGERRFTGWMAPRGIVAAATASTFGTGLAAHHVGGAAKILPATFVVIVATVTLYGLTAVPVARWLGVTALPVAAR